MSDQRCTCSACENARALARAVRALKAKWPKPEYDWEGLEDQDRWYRERVKLGDVPRTGGRW